MFYPGDAHIDPGQFVHGLAEVAKEMGVDIQPFTEVLGWQCSGRCVTTVHTTRGDLQPSRIVLAAGAWSSSVVNDLGLQLIAPLVFHVRRFENGIFIFNVGRSRC